MTRRLSASQITTYRSCARKWGWSYIAGIKGPPNASAELGSATHKQLETYLGGGCLDFTTEAGNIAASGLEHLPKPGTPGIKIEEEFHFAGPSGNTYLGYIDVEVPKEAKQAKFGLDLAVVIDHKTTSDLKWQKTADDLRTDVQANLYATKYFSEHPEDAGVELRWVYYLTRRTRKSAVTSLIVTPEDTWKEFLKIEETAKEMAAIETKNPLDLPPTVSHCNAYGGCPYQGNCNLSPFDKLKAVAAQHKEDLLKQPPKETENFIMANALLDRLKANKNIQATPVEEAPAAPAPAAPAPAAPAPAAINPPEWQPPPVNEEARREAEIAARLSADKEAAAANPVLAATLESMKHDATEKRKPGRPRKVVTDALPVVSAPVAPPASPPPAPPAPLVSVPVLGPTVNPLPTVVSAPVKTTKNKIGTLYIDCSPNKHVVDASVFILAAKVKIRAEGLADYRFADYGRGPGMLAVATAYEVEAQVGTIEAVRVDSATPEGSAVLTELIARADTVVR